MNSLQKNLKYALDISYYDLLQLCMGMSNNDNQQKDKHYAEAERHQQKE
jgi:hypothetical protein